VFLHQFRKDIVLGSQLGLKLLDPFLVRVILMAISLLECGSAVLEELFLPAVENRWLQVIFIAQVRDRNLVNKVPFQNDDFFLSCVVFSFFAHGEFLRRRRLTHTRKFSNSR